MRLLRLWSLHKGNTLVIECMRSWYNWIRLIILTRLIDYCLISQLSQSSGFLFMELNLLLNEISMSRSFPSPTFALATFLQCFKKQNSKQNPKTIKQCTSQETAPMMVFIFIIIKLFILSFTSMISNLILSYLISSSCLFVHLILYYAIMYLISWNKTSMSHLIIWNKISMPYFITVSHISSMFHAMMLHTRIFTMFHFLVFHIWMWRNIWIQRLNWLLDLSKYLTLDGLRILVEESRNQALISCLQVST